MENMITLSYDKAGRQKEQKNLTGKVVEHSRANTRGVHLSFIGRSDTYLDTCATIRFGDDTIRGRYI